MSTAKDLTDALIRKIKSMERFEIKREMEGGWLPRGVVPFDISIKDGVGTFIVYAESYIDAEDQVSQYLEREQDE